MLKFYSEERTSFKCENIYYSFSMHIQFEYVNNYAHQLIYYRLLIGCACYCPLWPCRPMLYDL